MISIALLGCGGCMPIPLRYMSSTLIQYNGRKCLIDCGEGTQVSMQLLGWGFKSIDVICLSHFHGDHIYGLPGLLATIGKSGRTEPLVILGPTGLNTLFNDLKSFLPHLPYELIFYENPRRYEFSNITISTLPLLHSIPCLGYSFYINRSPKFDVKKAQKNDIPKKFWNILQKGEKVVDNGNIYTKDMVLGEERSGIKISYVTDTRPLDTIPPFISKSDLFICEGTYGNDTDFKKAINHHHMTFREAAQLAKKGCVKELVLTHFSPSLIQPSTYYMNAKEVFENTSIGTDRLIKMINFKKND
ncbi:ribonuclease Z [Mycoplasmatota bacterium]|nr:ribonuclease Z [Mycoplasmatota bacterium]